MRGGAEVACQAHNLKVPGSIPGPATNFPQRYCFMYYVYILQLSNNQLYTGQTNNLKRRLSEHKSGKVTFTSQRLPVGLIHYEAYMLKSDAMRREKYLKTTEGKRFLHQQVRDYLVSIDYY
jgi:putative endonuclease